ncbi:hypothetical protein OTSTA716_2249 [Orientia tsutsugamushi str. TA716]|uniref:Uncharacterized protein n=1 Tax=Orientia tsutsugamushi str. TA716 TaxID=1359175 RepID=A0A0F3NTX4_ORITS|nr:hypothetical protein OTSTA716_2249 [Orientia tsutsugamushi str. TA716]
MLIKVKAITGFLRMIFVNSDNLLLDLTPDSAFSLSFSSNPLLLYYYCLNCPVPLFLRFLNVNVSTLSINFHTTGNSLGKSLK